MPLTRSHRAKAHAGTSWVQRLLACGMLLLAAFLVLDPLWECADHLDDLRHLGPHGMLIILLLVACAGISLLKTFQWIGLLLHCVAARLRPFALSRQISACIPAPVCVASPPPLRI
uniref:Uncharacterized protein n=1 Tax=Acidobacterium capsulatum TaxID=33075 RepID=A0A7V5CSE2_9BACT